MHWTSASTSNNSGNVVVRTRPASARHRGSTASYVDTEHRLSSDTELHALGRDVTGQIQSQKAGGIPFLTSPFSGSLIRWMRALIGSKRTLRLCESQMTRRSLAVTNLGLLERLDVQERYGALEIEELHFFAAVSVMGPLGATATYVSKSPAAQSRACGTEARPSHDGALSTSSDAQTRRFRFVKVFKQGWRRWVNALH